MMKRLSARKLEREQRAELLEAINVALDSGDLSLGQALRFLRAEYLGKSRKSFGEMVDVSAPALARLEADEGNPTMDTLNQVFRPFGYRVGLIPLGGRVPRVDDLSDERYQELLENVLEILAQNPRGS